MNGLIHIPAGPGGSRALLALTGALLVTAPAWAQDTSTWQRREVNWRMSGGMRVRAVYAPPGQLADRPRAAGQGQPVGANVIDSPPIDGFVPWVAISTTDKRDEPLATMAIPEPAIDGAAFVADPTMQYAIGLFDTGASGTVIGFEAANQLGLYAAGQVTGIEVPVSGVTGTVVTRTTQPLGLFIEGLDAVDPDTGRLDLSGMIGQSNVAILVGEQPAPGAPDLANAIGAPMAVYASTVFQVDTPVSRTINGTTYTGPLVEMYFDREDPRIPQYTNLVPLQLRPSGGTAVEYFPCFEIFECPGNDDEPQTPSMVSQFSFPVQSLFFISEDSGVDLYDNGRSSLINDDFMIDTGAQVTVVGNSIAARLALNPNRPDFVVDIQGVDGTVVQKPGFYLDAIDIPALGEWLSFTNVPVVLLNVASPEGGSLDGIIGMNLFVEYNFVFHGGGLFGQPSPELGFERINVNPVWGDADGDRDVDGVDYDQFTGCMSGPDIPQIDDICLFFDADADSDVDQADFGVFQGCVSGEGNPADPNCGPALIP